MNLSKELFEQYSVPRVIAKFAIPTILSQLITLIYNLADTFFVGHTNDPAQVAALTLSFPLFMMMTMVANLFGIGANSFISRSLGQGNRENASKASSFAFYSALILILFIAVILKIFMVPILTGVGAVTQEAFAATEAYLTWTLIYGGIPSVGALMLGHLIRAEGNTRQASIGMALGGILNIGLDFIFVQLLGLGAEGAGIATFLSNIASFLYLLRIVYRTENSVISLNPSKFRPQAYIARQVILVGMPAAAVIILGASMNIILTHLISAYGDVSIAAFGIVQKFGNVIIQITVGLTQGIMPLLGFCYGAGEIRKVKEINRCAFIILSIYAASCILIVELFTQPLILFFTSEPATVAKGIVFLKIWFFCAPGMCFVNLFCSIFQAMGKWLPSLVLSCIRQAGFLGPLLILFNSLYGEIGLIYAQPVADTCGLIAGIIMYAVTLKRSQAALNRQALQASQTAAPELTEQ